MLWDDLCARVLHVPDAGVRLDRAIVRAVPAQVVDELDVSLGLVRRTTRRSTTRPRRRPADREADRLTAGFAVGAVEPGRAGRRPGARRPRAWSGLTSPDPLRFTQGELRDALAARRSRPSAQPGARAGHRHVPGRRPVPPGGRPLDPRALGRPGRHPGHAQQADRDAHPVLRSGGGAGRPIVAVWVYQDNSLVTSYLDFQSSDRYILWHAPNAQQFNFDDPADLNHMLFNLGLEALDQLDKVLTKRYRPRNPV